MLARPDRVIVIAQAVICVLLVAAAAFGGFPNPVPVLFVAAALGAANAAFDLMRTFGSALLAGVAVAGVALAGIPFMTCSSPRFSTVFDCTGNSPSWHLTGSVIAAGLSGASLVLARTAARALEYDRLTGIERRLTELQRDMAAQWDLARQWDPTPRDPAGRRSRKAHDNGRHSPEPVDSLDRSADEPRDR